MSSAVSSERELGAVSITLIEFVGRLIFTLTVIITMHVHLASSTRHQPIVSRSATRLSHDEMALLVYETAGDRNIQAL